MDTTSPLAIFRVRRHSFAMPCVTRRAHLVAVAFLYALVMRFRAFAATLVKSVLLRTVFVELSKVFFEPTRVAALQHVDVPSVCARAPALGTRDSTRESPARSAVWKVEGARNRRPALESCRSIPLARRLLYDLAFLPHARTRACARPHGEDRLGEFIGATFVVVVSGRRRFVKNRHAAAIVVARRVLPGRRFRVTEVLRALLESERV
jgi:hypothetical protein